MNTTRDRIIKVAESLILKYGFNHTGIAEILKLAEVPKGSFYHHFESKEALGYAIIEKAAKDKMDSLNAFFNTTGGSPLRKVKLFFENISERINIEDINGCILGNLGQELAEQHEGFRHKLDQVFDEIEHFFAERLEEAKKEKQLSEDIDCALLAAFLFSSWEGAILSSKIKKSKEPLLNFIHVVFDQILVIK